MYGMKFVVISALIIVVSCSASPAQGPAKPIESPRDPAMEIAAKHHLEVARWYLTKRKAYEGARDRLQEIMDTYPDFSRMHEVLFLMGEAQLKLGKNDKAIEYYNKLLKDYPDSEFAKKAHERLDELKTGTEKK
jgi:outer membrane protein assembly factor BamD (BamD/ComL family)